MKVLCNGVRFRFEQKLATIGFLTSDPVTKSRKNNSATRTFQMNLRNEQPVNKLVCTSFHCYVLQYYTPYQATPIISPKMHLTKCNDNVTCDMILQANSNVLMSPISRRFYLTFNEEAYTCLEKAWLGSEYILKGFKNLRPHPVVHGPCVI